MSVWLTIPSARPAAEAQKCLDAWRERGYLTAIWRDPGAEPVRCDVMVQDPYPGYAVAVNKLIKLVLRFDARSRWCVAGGDDTWPDANHAADEIGHQCSEHFDGTLGVMQPTGDRFASGSIDRIAGSPWIGREWGLRGNGGAGAFWPEFTHMYGDECLQRTAQALGIYWQRPDLTHLHRHFMRESDAIDSHAVRRNVPTHLVHWNSQEHWNESQTIFKRLESQGFRPCFPIDERKSSECQP